MGRKLVKYGAKKNSRKQQMALARKRRAKENADENENDSLIDSTSSTTNSIVDSHHDTDSDATIVDSDTDSDATIVVDNLLSEDDTSDHDDVINISRSEVKLGKLKETTGRQSYFSIAYPPK